MVLSAYLFGPTSNLYQTLVLGKQLVDSMDGLYGNPPRDPSLFGALLRVKDPKNMRTVELSVLKDVKALAGGRVDATRMDAARSNLKYSNIISLETPDSIAVSLAVLTSPTGDVDYFNKLYAEVDKVKPADLSEFAKKHMLDSNRTTVTLQTSKTRVAAGGAR
jgi:zinc protease